jgi:hypothetical protein
MEEKGKNAKKGGKMQNIWVQSKNWYTGIVGGGKSIIPGEGVIRESCIWADI